MIMSSCCHVKQNGYETLAFFGSIFDVLMMMRVFFASIAYLEGAQPNLAKLNQILAKLSQIKPSHFRNN
jgi:hypothetical protein